MDTVFFKNENFTWYNLMNPSKVEMDQFRNEFGLTSYTVNDANEIGHLPKFEHQEQFDFILLRFYIRNKRLHSNQISEFSHKIGIFKGNHFLITMHQEPVPFWDMLKAELDGPNNSKLTSVKLLYKISEYILNIYFAPSERISKQIEWYEDSLFGFEKELKINLKKLYQLKRESSACNKLLLMTRDVLNEFKIYTQGSISI